MMKIMEEAVMRSLAEDTSLSCASLDAIQEAIENPERFELLAVESKIAKAAKEVLYKVYIPDAIEENLVLVAVPKGMMSDKWLQCLTCEFFTPEAGCVTSEDCPYDCPYEPEQSCPTCNIRRGYEESNNWCGISENRPAGDTCTGWEPR